jgi:hypothetical protein
MDTPIRAVIIPALSNIVFFFTAEIAPIIIPSSEANMMADMASSMVAGKRESISFITGVFE